MILTSSQIFTDFKNIIQDSEQAIGSQFLVINKKIVVDIVVCEEYFSDNFTAWFLYIFCLWVTGYYCWKYIFEKIKSIRLVYVFLSNIIFSFVLIWFIFTSYSFYNFELSYLF